MQKFLDLSFVVLVLAIALQAAGCQLDDRYWQPQNLPQRRVEISLTDGSIIEVVAAACKAERIPDNGHGDWGNPRTPVLLLTCWRDKQVLVSPGGLWYEGSEMYMGLVGEFYAYSWRYIQEGE